MAFKREGPGTSIYSVRRNIRVLTNSTDKYPTLREKFSDNQWIAALAFLVDIFEAFNVVNKLLQGNDTNVIICKDKITAFSIKLDLWITKINDGNFAAFQPLIVFWMRRKLHQKRIYWMQ